MASSLMYRKVTTDDSDELISMRRACGWGEAKVPHFISRTVTGDAAVMYIFHLSSDRSPVGMGGLQFTPLDGSLPGLSSREDGKVQISGLFVYPHWAGKGYGREIMVILERLAVEDYGAKIMTMGTRPENDDGSPNVVMEWYVRLGYREFLPRIPHLRDKPDGPLLLGAFLSKQVAAQ